MSEFDPEQRIPVETSKADPTYMTMGQIRREVTSLREILETRLNAIDKATTLFQENLTLVPVQVDKQIAHLKNIHDVRFDSIERQTDIRFQNMIAGNNRTLQEMDLRYQQRYDASDKALQAASLAAKEAVNAALAAAKEAVLTASISAEKSTAAAFAASEKAIDKAESAQRAHNLSQNEWRATISDLTKTVGERARTDSENMVNSLRTNTEISIRGLTDKVDGAIARLDKTDGRGSQASSTQGTMLAVAAIAISLLMAGFNILSSMKETSGISVVPPVTLGPPAGGRAEPSPQQR